MRKTAREDLKSPQQDSNSQHQRQAKRSNAVHADKAIARTPRIHQQLESRHELFRPEQTCQTKYEEELRDQSKSNMVHEFLFQKCEESDRNSARIHLQGQAEKTLPEVPTVIRDSS
jgi:hypothetical protein